MTGESLNNRLRGLYTQYRGPAAAGLLAGAAAHMYAATNKLLNADEITTLFGKGATLQSGRWGIELFKYILPEYSMPWLWTLLTVLFLTAAACMITGGILKLRSKLLQGVLNALLVSFPSVTGTLCYMFTSSLFALAFLFAISAVFLWERTDQRWEKAAAVLLMVLSLSIYQAYVAMAAGLFVTCMIRELTDGEKAVNVLKRGIVRLIFLAVSLVIYAVINFIVIRLTGAATEEYAYSENSLLMRTAVAYSAFLHTFTNGYFSFVRSDYSRILHGIVLIIMLCSLTRWTAEKPGRPEILLMLVCLLIFPLSLYCIYLMASTSVIHSLVLYSFTCVYLLAAVLAERMPPVRRIAGTDAILLLLTLVCLSNIFFANKIYLQMNLQYEETEAFYTGLVTRIQSTEGYTAETHVALIGYPSEQRYDGSDFNTDYSAFTAITPNLADAYSKKDFIRYYTGADLVYTDAAETEAILSTDEYTQMPVYPYDGSVKMIGSVVVVKLS